MEKLVFAWLAVLLSAIAYIPYVIDTLKGKTTPHMYSWLIWSIISLTNSAIYFYNDGGNGTIPMFTSFIIIFFIFLLSIFNGHRDIKKKDVYFLIGSLVAFSLWFFIENPLLASIVATSTSILALGPTLRKSWDTPYSETLTTYSVNTLRHVLIFLSLGVVNITTAINPVSWVIANIILSLVLIYRRSELNVNA
jgi:hypothetical protein